jgi:hypothetical protein
MVTDIVIAVLKYAAVVLVVAVWALIMLGLSTSAYHWLIGKIA